MGRVSAVLAVLVLALTVGAQDIVWENPLGTSGSFHNRGVFVSSSEYHPFASDIGFSINLKFGVETDVVVTLWNRGFCGNAPVEQVAVLHEQHFTGGESFERELRWTVEEWLESGFGFGSFFISVARTVQFEDGYVIEIEHHYIWVYEAQETKRQEAMAQETMDAFVDALLAPDRQRAAALCHASVQLPSPLLPPEIGNLQLVLSPDFPSDRPSFEYSAFLMAQDEKGRLSNGPLVRLEYTDAGYQVTWLNPDWASLLRQ